MEDHKSEVEEARRKGRPAGRRFRTLLLRCGLALLAVLALAAAALLARLDRLLKFSIESAGTYAAGVPVTVESIRLKLLKGQLRIRGLQVGNPQGYRTPHALRVGEVFVSLDVASLLGREIHVREVGIDGTEVTYEAAGLTKSNLNDLYRNVRRLAEAAPATAPPPGDGGRQKDGRPATSGQERQTPGNTPAPEAPASPAPEGNGRRVVIDHVRITRSRFGVSAKLFRGGKLNLVIPDVHLEDLGREKELTTTGAVAAILDEFLGTLCNVARAGERLVDGAAEAIRKTSKEVVRTLRQNEADIKETLHELRKSWRNTRRQEKERRRRRPEPRPQDPQDQTPSQDHQNPPQPQDPQDPPQPQDPTPPAPRN